MPLHEIAQINVARALKRKYPSSKIVLEQKIDTGKTTKNRLGIKRKVQYEADIVMDYKYVWEVKPIRGADPKPQLELYTQFGGLTKGEKLSKISNITVFEDIKMEITFPNKGEVRYSLYTKNANGTIQELATVSAAIAILAGLMKMIPAGKRFAPAF